MSVRMKKAIKSPRSIQYLLSADPRLQRISLRRISERLKKAKPSPRAIRMKNPPGSRNSMRLPLAMSSQAILLGVICVVAAAALVTARQPSHRADVASVDAREASARLEHVPMAARLETKNTVVSKAPPIAAVVKTNAAAVSMPKTLAVESVKTPAVESTAEADVQSVAPVVITGCLERDEETFWLKDTAGVDAPKSRSWRSGFLKKRPSRIELVDASKTLTLTIYVGHRIAATGMLRNGEMRARSLRQIAESCD
jgi:hypothetical protein